MFKKLRGMFSSDLSIDLGTANTLIYVRERGIVATGNVTLRQRGAAIRADRLEYHEANDTAPTILSESGEGSPGWSASAVLPRRVSKTSALATHAASASVRP